MFRRGLTTLPPLRPGRYLFIAARVACAGMWDVPLFHLVEGKFDGAGCVNAWTWLSVATARYVDGVSWDFWNIVSEAGDVQGIFASNSEVAYVSSEEYCFQFPRYTYEFLIYSVEIWLVVVSTLVGFDILCRSVVGVLYLLLSRRIASYWSMKSMIEGS